MFPMQDSLVTAELSDSLEKMMLLSVLPVDIKYITPLKLTQGFEFLIQNFSQISDPHTV